MPPRPEYSERTRAKFQHSIRPLFVRSHKVSKPRYLCSVWTDHFEIWQASGQHCCRDACQISKRCDYLNYRSRGFESSRDLTIRCLIGYWNKVLVNAMTNDVLTPCVVRTISSLGIDYVSITGHCFHTEIFQPPCTCLQITLFKINHRLPQHGSKSTIPFWLITLVSCADAKRTYIRWTDNQSFDTQTISKLNVKLYIECTPSQQCLSH